MNVQNRIAAGAAARVSSPNELSVLKQPSCPAAIWDRETPQAFQTWVDTLPQEQLPRARLILRRDAVQDAMHEITAKAGLPDCAEHAHLAQDVTHLARLFSKLMGAAHLRLRLDVIKTNACRKFHIDAVTARLVCTYRGTGTQHGVSRGGEDPHQIHTTPTGAPILLRGTLWPAAPDAGFVHRSPPILDASGAPTQTRLVLVLDPVAEVEAALAEEQALLH